jgi:HD-GYP domain-containing protein (c-di-GMP phosphodiesterase class II)
MPKLILQHPIHTLDQRLLFAPGAFLTKETLGAVIGSHTPPSQKTHPLLSYGSVKEDLSEFLGTPPYATIFSERKRIEFLNLSETACFPIPILQSLTYFREHDFHTYSHVLMVFALSTLLAKDLMPEYDKCLEIFATGPTHDIGKICVPLPILKKRTPLTRSERALLEHHAAASFVLLSYYCGDLQHLACRVALEHHERRDGSGYPRKLPLRDPMVEIVAVSDVYDALIKPRAYRSAPFDNRTALEEITRMAEQNKIGWDVVRALVALNRKSHPHYKEITLSAEKRGTPPAYNAYGILAEEEETKE